MKTNKKCLSINRRFLLVLIAFLMTVQLCVFPVSAVEETSIGGSENALAMPDIINAVVSDSEKEYYTQRAYDQEQFLNDVVFSVNGRSYVSYIFSEEVKYVDEQGNIKDKDTTLVATNGGYQQKSNNIQSFLPTHIDSGIQFGGEGYTVSFSPVVAQDVVVAPISVTNNGYGNNSATYNRVFGEKTAIRYTPYYSSLKEEIVLSGYTGQNKFDFIYLVQGLNFDETEGLKLVTEQGEAIFEFPEFIVYDSQGKTVQCDYLLQEILADKGLYSLSIVVPQDYLTDITTQYPVYVDPTINIVSNSSNTSIIDTTVYTGQTSALSGTETTLSVGNYGSGREAIGVIQFNQLLTNSSYRTVFQNTNIAKKVILGVLNTAVSAEASVDAKLITSLWSETTATISNITLGATIDTAWVGEDMGTGRGGQDTGNWYHFDITAAMEQLCASTPTAHGIAFDANTYDGCVKFASSEYSASLSKPFIRAQYSIEPLPNKQTEGILSGAVYSIKDAIETTFAISSEENGVCLRPYNESSTQQQFKIIYKGNGKYVIREYNENNMLLAAVEESAAYVGFNDDPDVYWYIVPISSSSASSVTKYHFINASYPFGVLNASGFTSGSGVSYNTMEYFAEWSLVLMDDDDLTRYALYYQNILEEDGEEKTIVEEQKGK